MNNLSNTRVVVAMSGGVDSSVAAALLVRQGYYVIGVTMKLWEYQDLGGNINMENSCCSVESINDARSVCQVLDIPHYVLDFKRQFRNQVVDNFISEYLKGRTPNPCIDCNTRIKWDLLLNKTKDLGAEYLATGHYARVEFNQEFKRFILRKGKYAKKDQSYALWGLTQKSLAGTLLPIGDLTKAEVRQIAETLGLKTADKEESQDICFIPDNNYRRLLKDHLNKNGNGFFEQGDMVTTEGKVVGRHEGYHNFTIGQRKGLGVALGKPVYVVDILPESNRVIIGEKKELLCKGLVADQLNWIALEELTEPGQFFIKIRYNDAGFSGILSYDSDRNIRAEFIEPQSAVTPGQSVVFYINDSVLGGGIIKHSF